MIAALFLARWPIALATLSIVVVGGLAARRRHLIICRTYWRAVFVAIFAIDLWIAGTAWLIWGLSNALADLIFFTVFNLIYPWEPGVRPVWRQMKQHRDHDEDCEYGPRRRLLIRLKLVRWKKVVINPAFAPS